MRTVEVDSFIDFIKQVDVFEIDNDRTVFRGQPVKRNLLPSVARKRPSKDREADEREMLSDLRRIAAAYLPDQQITDLDLMVRAQHFGMKTRLLDWTENAMTALYFSCAGGGTEDSYVYALDIGNLNVGASEYSDDPFKRARTGVFWPRLNNPRISAQNGLFTLHRYSKSSGAYVALENNTDTKDRLTELRISGSAKKRIVESLDRYGVNNRTLFPDFEGVCRYINSKNYW